MPSWASTARRWGVGTKAPVPDPSPRPRLLVVTPDFPPSPGGIQLVLHRLVAHMPGFETRVVTRAGLGADDWDQATGLDVTRARLPVNSKKAGLVNLNLHAIAQLRRFRPHLVLA